MRAASDDATLSPAQAAAAASGVKALVTVGSPGAERPFLDHQLSELADAGLTDVCLVIGPEHDGIRDHVTSLDLSRVRVEFAVQERPMGTADAVRAARSVVSDDRFVVLNSDNLYPAGAVRRLVELSGCGLAGFEPHALARGGNIPASRISAFALLGLGPAGELVDIVEKPTTEQHARFGAHALVSMNCWLLGPSIFPAIDRIGVSTRGEFELPDAVRVAIAAGERFDVVPITDAAEAGVLDLSGRNDIAAVAARLAAHEVRM